MQLPPSALVPLRLWWSAGVSEVERSVCYVITESVLLIKRCKTHVVVIPLGFCIKLLPKFRGSELFPLLYPPHWFITDYFFIFHREGQGYNPNLMC